jgi:hypothetical protein
MNPRDLLAAAAGTAVASLGAAAAETARAADAQARAGAHATSGHADRLNPAGIKVAGGPPHMSKTSDARVKLR